VRRDSVSGQSVVYSSWKKQLAGKETETTVTTRNDYRRAACGVGAALLALSSGIVTVPGSAWAAGNPQNPTQPHGQFPPPNVLVKQNDLAAESLYLVPKAGEPSRDGRTNLVAALLATCKNRGTHNYKPGTRSMVLYHRVGGVDQVVVSQPVPALAPGKSFYFTYTLPPFNEAAEDDEGYWVEITQGSVPDENPGNDTFAEEDPLWGAPDDSPIVIGHRD
jgi:hypothetical protein